MNAHVGTATAMLLLIGDLIVRIPTVLEQLRTELSVYLVPAPPSTKLEYSAYAVLPAQSVMSTRTVYGTTAVNSAELPAHNVAI